MTGAFPNAAYCDRAYKGNDGHNLGTHVYVQSTKRECNEELAKRLKQRAAVEPVIGQSIRVVGPEKRLAPPALAPGSPAEQFGRAGENSLDKPPASSARS